MAHELNPFGLPEDLAHLLADEDEARQYLLDFCWPNGVTVCPRCDNEKIYTLSGERLRCSQCKYTFQPFSGRWINTGNLSCIEWLRIILSFLEEKSVHEIRKDLSLSYNTVYKALTAIRFSLLAHAVDAPQLLSPQTGLNSYLKGNKLTGGPKDLKLETLPVFGIVRRNNFVFIDIVPGFQAETIFHFHLNFRLPLIRAGNLLYTDKYKEYDALIMCGNDTLPYEVIRRSPTPPYIDTLDDTFWKKARLQFKKFRGISCQRFPLYLKELEFRYNNRDGMLFPQLLACLCDIVPSVD